MELRQTGKNPDYPMKADTWRMTDPIPEWLSDRAAVLVDDYGEVSLKTRDETSGGIEILESGERNILVRMKTKDSILLYSKTHPIMSVTPRQLKLLY